MQVAPFVFHLQGSGGIYLFCIEKIAASFGHTGSAIAPSRYCPIPLLSHPAIVPSRYRTVIPRIRYGSIVPIFSFPLYSSIFTICGPAITPGLLCER